MLILSVSENILFFVCGFGVLQGVLLAMLIYFHPRSDRSVNLFLALYIFFTSVVMALPFIMNVVGWQNSFFAQPIPLLTGPLLYLYLRSFKETITFRKAWPHFLIFFVFLGIAYWNLSRFGALYPEAKQVPEQALQHPLTIGMQFIRTGQQIVYFFLARQVLVSYQRSIRQMFSETSRIDLQWAKFLIYGFIVLVSVFLVIFPLMLRFPGQFNVLLFTNMVIATPYIYIATFKGITQHTIWQIQPDFKKEATVKEIQLAERVTENIIQRPSANRTNISGDKIEGLVKRITALMEGEKLYQETELTLQQLAEKLQIPTYLVSQALNEGMKKNFYDLVNGYRVEEAKRLLLDSGSKNFTILSVGFEAGFNSKTTFNTVFKKFTGLTPTEYRNRKSPVHALV